MASRHAVKIMQHMDMYGHFVLCTLKHLKKLKGGLFLKSP